MQISLYQETSKPGRIFLSPGVWALISFFIMVFIMGLLKIYSPDLGFHLKSAEWIIDHKQFIYTDSFSLSSEGNRYFDLQWLYQLFIYTLYKRGESVLIIANALLITVSLVLVWFRFLRNTAIDKTNIKIGLFAFMALLSVQPLSFEIRPHVLSWIFLNLTLFFLESYKRGNKKALFVLPVIMLFWANTHSLAVLGLVTIAIYNAGIYFEKKKIDRRLLVFSGISFAAFAINPYFIEGLLFPFTQFGIISGNSLFKTSIAEFQSPFSIKGIEAIGWSKYFTSPLLLIHLSAILSLFSIFRSVKQRQFTDSLLLAAFLFLLHLGHKNYGYYLMVTLPLIIKYSLNWLESRKKKKSIQKTSVDKRKNKAKEEIRINVEPRVNRKFYTRISFATIIIAILISVTYITDGYQIFVGSPYRFGFTTDKDALPVEATNYLIKNNIKGKVLNNFNFGGYLMFHYKEKVFIDGRIEPMKEEFFRKYSESNTVPDRIKNLLNEYDPDIVIFPYLKATNWWSYFILHKKESGYKAVYFDGLSVIYLKSSAYPQIPEVNEKNILLTLDRYAYTHLDELIREKKPGRFAILIKGLWQKQVFSIADENMATYCFTNHFDTAAISLSVRGIENSTIHTPNIYKNLSIYYKEKKMFYPAELCEEKAKE